MSIHHAYEETVPKLLHGMEKKRKQYGVARWWHSVGGTIFQTLLPTIENILVFILATWLNSMTQDGSILQGIDFYLLYALLFAGVYGKGQGVLAAFLGSVGFAVQQLFASGGGIFIDLGTYVWIAQLFVVSMIVGYTRDRVQTVLLEKREQEEYLQSQVQDIIKVNQSNLQLKNVMEQRLITYDGSLGQLYEVTAKLDQVAVGEVLFYAADTVGQVMGSKDVAIYRVDRSDYGRLMAARSKEAQVLGKSIRLENAEYSELLEAFRDNKVYINRGMKPGLPLMASALQSDGRIRFIIMLWGLSFESMTLHQADVLTVLSYMVFNAANRSEAFWQALKEQRSVEGTSILNVDSFQELVQGCRNACKLGLTEYTVLKIQKADVPLSQWNELLDRVVRETDYAGICGDGNIGILLMNSNQAESGFVVGRLAKAGITAVIDEASV